MHVLNNLRLKPLDSTQLKPISQMSTAPRLKRGSRKYNPDEKDDTLKRALPRASNETRMKLQRVVEDSAGSSADRSSGPAAYVTNTEHLLVREELPLATGGTFIWEFYRPLDLVQHVLNTCSSLAEVYARKLDENPPTAQTPWRIQLACDEHSPGSKISVQNARKNMIISFNFVELGADVLELDFSWFWGNINWLAGDWVAERNMLIKNIFDQIMFLIKSLFPKTVLIETFLIKNSLDQNMFSKLFFDQDSFWSNNVLNKKCLIKAFFD